ncbi:MAG: Peptidase propeptide and domain [Pseudomonadota bacterium]|jgi:uncharacterized membrane protein YkoI
MLSALLLLLAAPGYGQLLPAPVPEPLDLNRGGRQERPAQASGVRISERQAVELARQQFGGNVLRISLVGEGSEQRYQLRMENEGKIFTVFVHAITGQVTGG